MSGLTGRYLRLEWTLAVRDDPRLSAVDKHLGLTLATFMRGNGYCWPGIKTIANAMSVSERTVQNHLNGELALLVELGYLSVTPGGGRGHTHAFQAVLPTKTAPTADAVGNGTPLPQNGAPHARKGAAPTANGAARAPELVMNTSDNPPNADTGGPRSEPPHIEASDDETFPDWQDLVDELPDSDDRTREVFERDFPKVEPDDLRHVLEQFRAQDDGHIRNPTGYVRRILADIQRARAPDEYR